MKMIEIKKKEECCGCNACVQICPKKCISIQTDTEGFWYPNVNEAKCVHCDMCVKVCPVINKEERKPEEIPVAFAVYAKNSILRDESSSGGIFSLLAEQVLQNGGTVFGAAFTSDWQVYHIAVNDKKNMYMLRGSKYLQSNIENTYIEAKRVLDSQKEVLFSGTGCQIEGLQRFLGKDYDNLITVDILCHGVPSPKVWDKYRKYQEKQYNSKARDISFRNKSQGWRKFSLKIGFENGAEYSQILDEDIFMQLFLRNICLRPSCYNCKFKSLHRSSDITIGDFWGIENVAPDVDDDKGTSLVLGHTSKGRSRIQALEDKVRVQKVDAELALPESAESRHSVAVHRNRTKFFLQLDKKEINQLAGLIKDPVMIRARRKVKSLLKRIIGYN